LKPAMSLTVLDVIQALGFPEKACVALTGGGGKTTLLGVLGRAFTSLGRPVLLTTTTKVQRPFPVAVDWFVEEDDPGKLEREVLSKWTPGTLGMAVGGPFGGHKWAGVSPGWVDGFFSQIEEGVILNEADGALRLPIKAPADHEPVIPETTTHVIPVVGLSVLGAPLDETHAFRPRLIAERTGLAMGSPITKTAVSRLIVDPRGITKGAPGLAEIIPFLNQADTPELAAAGVDIGREILSLSDRIESVLVGRLKPVPLFRFFQNKIG